MKRAVNRFTAAAFGAIQLFTRIAQHVAVRKAIGHTERCEKTTQKRLQLKNKAPYCHETNAFVRCIINTPSIRSTREALYFMWGSGFNGLLLHLAKMRRKTENCDFCIPPLQDIPNSELMRWTCTTATRTPHSPPACSNTDYHLCEAAEKKRTKTNKLDFTSPHSSAMNLLQKHEENTRGEKVRVSPSREVRCWLRWRNPANDNVRFVW